MKLFIYDSIIFQIVITCREHSRVVSDTSSDGDCGELSVNELKAVHEQLCLIHPSLGPYLPDLPSQPQGFWAYFYKHESPTDSFCSMVEDYFRIAFDICGKGLLLNTLFGKTSYDEYFENISELKRRKYDESVDTCQQKLQNILSLRSGSVNMLDKLQYYSLEDSAMFDLNVALADLYNYLLQPFLDMREMSLAKLKEAKNGLQNENYGDRLKKEYADMFAEWQENYEHALDAICQHYIDYYSKTVSILKGKKFRIYLIIYNTGNLNFC